MGNLNQALEPTQTKDWVCVLGVRFGLNQQCMCSKVPFLIHDFLR